MLDHGKKKECPGCTACQLFSQGKKSAEGEVCPEAKVKFPLLVFGVPIILFFVGVGVGSLFSEKMAIILGIGFLLTAFLLVRFLSSHVVVKQERSR